MRNASLASIAAAALAVVAPGLASAQARTFRVESGSRVTFVSEAPLETINGVSSRVTGELRVNTASLGSTTGSFTVPVSSLRTGIDLRDEHLQSDTWLDAAENPNITFELTRVEGASSITANQTVNVRVRGRLTIHGVTREVTARGQAKLMQENGNDVLRFRARFTVRLSEFNVSIPLPVRLKVSDEIQVGINARAVAAG
jgi:polyisoprenoid-binding protein YceI